MRTPKHSRRSLRVKSISAALTLLGGAALLPAQPATAAQTGPQEQQIVNELPSGFGPSSCATAADPGTAAAHFQSDSNPGPNFAPAPCPGADGSPSNWNYTSTPDQVEGQILCGTFQNNADVEWTRNSQSLLIDVLGNSDIDALYTWWAHYGNPKSGEGLTPNTAATLGHI
jgi:hypothetical protein